MAENLERAFVKELDDNQKIVHKICRLYTWDKPSHDDLFQEIAIQLWRAYPKFRGESKFSTWAYRIGLNTAITLYRKSARKISGDVRDWERHLVISNDYDFEIEERLEKLYDAVRQLNDIDKALVFMYLENKAYVEIAETLGISEVNARVKMKRAKDKLRKILKL